MLHASCNAFMVRSWLTSNFWSNIFGAACVRVLIQRYRQQIVSQKLLHLSRIANFFISLSSLKRHSVNAEYVLYSRLTLKKHCFESTEREYYTFKKKKRLFCFDFSHFINFYFLPIKIIIIVLLVVLVVCVCVPLATYILVFAKQLIKC